MKKIISLIIISIIILSSFCISNAEMNVPNDNIISISSNSIEPNQEFYLILNLLQIPYSKFKVEITNTFSLQVEEITLAVTELSKNNVVTSFVVDKNSVTLDKLGVVYVAPKQNSSIKFSVKITSLDENVEDLNKTLVNLDSEIVTLTNNLAVLQNALGSITDIESDEYKNCATNIEKVTENINSKTNEKNELQDKINNFEVQTVSKEITVNVEENKNNMLETDKKNPWDDKDSLLDDMMKERDKEMDKSMKKMMEQMNTLEFDLQNANNRISSLTQSTTYQGSQNNYLSSLSISGVDFKNNFKKTTTTYFASVDSSVTKVTVNAIAEDSSSIVTIYGNTNLQEGKNKVIINVTADDGSVRTYKIYITK